MLLTTLMIQPYRDAEVVDDEQDERKSLVSLHPPSAAVSISESPSLRFFLTL
jgi:hypothetical protein